MQPVEPVSYVAPTPLMSLDHNDVKKIKWPPYLGDFNIFKYRRLWREIF